MASKETVMQMLRRFSVVFDLRMDQDAIETWEMALNDLSDEVVQAATVHFVKSWGSQYNRKPRPGDVHEFFNEVFDTSWRDAWAEVQFLMVACQQPGSSVEFSSHAIKLAVESLGRLRTIYETPPALLPKLRDQFRDAYKEIKAEMKIKGIIEQKKTARIEYYAPDGEAIQEYNPDDKYGIDRLKEQLAQLPEPENHNWHTYESAKPKTSLNLSSLRGPEGQVIDISKIVKRG
jgi:hypothetical protein